MAGVSNSRGLSRSNSLGNLRDAGSENSKKQTLFKKVKNFFKEKVGGLWGSSDTSKKGAVSHLMSLQSLIRHSKKNDQEIKDALKGIKAACAGNDKQAKAIISEAVVEGVISRYGGNKTVSEEALTQEINAAFTQLTNITFGNEDSELKLFISEIKNGIVGGEASDDDEEDEYDEDGEYDENDYNGAVSGGGYAGGGGYESGSVGSGDQEPAVRVKREAPVRPPIAVSPERLKGYFSKRLDSQSDLQYSSSGQNVTVSKLSIEDLSRLLPELVIESPILLSEGVSLEIKKEDDDTFTLTLTNYQGNEPLFESYFQGLYDDQDAQVESFQQFSLSRDWSAAKNGTSLDEVRGIGKITVSFVKGSIVDSQGYFGEDPKPDCIVNAAQANVMTSFGGGVDGAIHAAANKGVSEDGGGGSTFTLETAPKQKLGSDGKLQKLTTDSTLSPGEACVSESGALKSNGVTSIIHTLAPDKRAGGTYDQLVQSYYNSLVLANKQTVNHLAFPGLGAGAFGWDGVETVQALNEALTRFHHETSTPAIQHVSIIDTLEGGADGRNERALRIPAAMDHFFSPQDMLVRAGALIRDWVWTQPAGRTTAAIWMINQLRKGFPSVNIDTVINTFKECLSSYWKDQGVEAACAPVNED
ncbi:hypothetical protein DID77_03485, partial [Candidatus Marinamargulisbacteria bacterium SCGC AG-439-L15]